jgi:hypothetical protein
MFVARNKRNKCMGINIMFLDILLSISETLHYSMSALHVKIVPLLDVLLLMLFAGTLTYSEPEAFSLIIFYNTLLSSSSSSSLHLFVCLLFCINVYFLQCLPVIYL